MEFKNVSILLPTLNETFSFIQTVKTILEECNQDDICEFIAIVCDRTLNESLEAIQDAKKISESKGIPLNIVWQELPFAGGAVRDGMSSAKGTHTIMMAPDLETDPHSVKDMIEMAKKYPEDITTASRWISKGSFQEYSKIKYMLNFVFQKIFSILYGVNLTDMSYGYRIAPTSLFQSIAWEELKHPFFLETALKPIRIGTVFHEIPSMWRCREEGTSQNNLIQTFRYVKTAFKIRFQKKSTIIKPGIRQDDQ
jgi:Glycosyl transferase family 2.